jgi:chromate transporter
MADPSTAQAAPAVPDGPVVPGSLVEIFVAFARVSLMSFGGVLPWARRMLVVEKRWMTPEEFNDLLALCQFLPGPNIVNVCAVWGSRVRGLPGVLACLFGLLGPSVALMIGAGTLYRAYGALPELRGVLTGLAAAAAGLIMSTAGQMAEPLLRRRPGPAHAVAAAGFIAVGILRLNLPLVILVLVPISIAFAWMQPDEK